MTKNKKVLIITIIVLAVLIIAGLVYFFFFRKNPNDFGVGEKRRAEIINELSSEYVEPITDQDRTVIVKELTSQQKEAEPITDQERTNIINELSGN